MNGNPRSQARSAARLAAVQALYQQQMEGTGTARLIDEFHQHRLGVSVDDTEAEAVQLAAKIAGLRMLDGEVSLVDAGAPALVVSQFTLYGDVRKGRRTSWTRSAKGEQAQPLYERFMAELESSGVRVERGVFGAMMDVSLTNSGPFTLIVDSDELSGPRRG